MDSPLFLEMKKHCFFHRRGHYQVGDCCPFCDAKDTIVYSERIERYYCWECGSSGDLDIFISTIGTKVPQEELEALRASKKEFRRQALMAAQNYLA